MHLSILHAVVIKSTITSLGYLGETSVKRLGVLIGILAVLAVGGGLSILITGGDELLPFLQQTSNPAGSVMEAESWQAEQLVLMIGFILFNLGGIAITLAIVMWFLHRGVAISRAEEAELAES